ncbi:ubiquitin thioesterase OTUB1-like [Ptychodera flava]|uniref:ubiquitin thioesterase OTUB1-like n=1 Tax=Ptychodera flava TaxID=63121 RepID=UPI00396A13C8
MAEVDEGKRVETDGRENNDKVVQDEAILAQQDRIEKEIAECTELIGDKEDLCLLKKEYSDEDQVYQQKLRDLMSRYSHIRKTRGDGNCFYRGFGYGYLECLLSDEVERKRFTDIAAQSKENLVALGFPSFTIEDFHDTFMDVIEKVDSMSVPELLDTFRDQGLSDYLVVYLRLLTSGQLQKETEFFENFVEGGLSVKDFCNREVEPMGKESDHIHIIALTKALGVGVRVEYMDRVEGGKINHHDFPEGCDPQVTFLYRPGHYDILYHS